ncbi:efflux RND transporter permease subunit [bacterium]|nr:efflux RND transporter permease subunit [bacterium]
MNVTRIAVEKNRVTLTALLLVVVAGVSAFFNMPRNEDPGFIIRTAAVMTYFPGASPERVEQLVTDKLEKVIQEIPELDHVRSESKTGVSLIYVDIREEYTTMRPIWDDLRRKVEKTVPQLPDSVVGPFVNDEFGDVFGILIGITGGDVEGEFEYSYLKDVADEMRDELLLINEVAKVEIHGSQDERIFIEYNNARLSELGISPLQLRALLEARNIIIPGGEVRTEFEELVLQPSGNFETVDDLLNAVIALPGQRNVLYLRDVADRIYRGYVDPPTTRMRSSGLPALTLAVSMREDGNIIRLGERVREILDSAYGNYPIGIEFEVLQFQPDIVAGKINAFVINLLQAVAIVSAVMLLTLGIRTGLIVATLIPMAILASLAVMQMFDVGLDQISIAALIIALGMLVDNAIVMSESIMVQMGAGQSAFDAAMSAADELKIPLLTSSLTTSAAFLPIYLAESSTGEYTAPLFKVVTITLMCSWVLSLTMIPLLCVKFLRVARQKQDLDGPFYRRYRAVLLTGLRHPWLSLTGVLLIFAVALAGFRFVPVIFFPPSDRATFTAELELPGGTPLARTQAVVLEIETFIREQLLADEDAGADGGSGIVSWASFIGEGAPRYILPYEPQQVRPEFAYMILNTASRHDVDDLIPRLERFANGNFPDLKATIRPLELGPPAWPPIEIRLAGRDSDELFANVDRLKARLAEQPGVKLIDDDWGSRSKKLVVRVDQPRARRAGVTNQDVAISLSTFLTGLEITEFREDDKLIPIVLRSAAAERQDLNKLETLNVYAQASGNSVPLSQVAEIELIWQPPVIRRFDRLRTVTVEAVNEAGTTADQVYAALRPWLTEQRADWSTGSTWEFGGEAEASGDAQASIGAKMPLGALIILLLLVGQFNSLRRPVIILLTIPLSLIGVTVGLLLTRSYFGFMTLLGIVSLAGIVINNAIVLLDRIRIEIENNGLPPAQAVLESSLRRLRPILLTTGTTVGGLIPLWLGGGPMFKPMAIAILFGLLFATALTLGVVPILYSLFFRVGFRDVR